MIKSTGKEPQVQPVHPGIPCAMVLRLIARSPREPGFLAPVAARLVTARLDASVGAPGPHAFAVRKSASRPRKACALSFRVHRIPRSRSVTIGHNAPLFEAGHADHASDSAKC